MPEEYERGFQAGYRLALSTFTNMELSSAEREILVDIGNAKPRVKPVKRKMKRSSWHKYMKNSKNQIKFKRGAKKGLLDMKSMAKAYKRSRK